MVEHDESKVESLLEKIADKIHGDDSSSDSDDDKPFLASFESKVYRLFGREKPIHKALGGGKPADAFLWRNKQISVGVLGGVTLVWTPPRIPDLRVPEDPVFLFASALTYQINRGILLIRDIGSGRDLKKFLSMVAGLWVLSIIGSSCNFLTLFFISFVLLHSLPVLYEKYEDQVDSLAEKAMAEFNKQYAVVDANVLSKIRRGPLKDKKAA